MQVYFKSLERLIQALHRLPGIGPKNAERLAIHILKTSKGEAEELANAILQARAKIKYCSICFNITESDICSICQDSSRNSGMICVVEQPQDVIVIEKTGKYKGKYHVLMGTLSPLDGVGPDDLKIKELMTRVQNNGISEVIVATNPNAEGEATAAYLSKLIKPLNIKITRLAHGIPMGGDLQYADEVTLTKALEGRREL
ncbi:recombination mediator RecR [bacterium]|nr:recombination mediator RecR [bacterium]